MNDIFGIAKVIEKVADPVIGLLQKIAGPAAEEIGLTLQDSVRVFRARRAYQLAEKVTAFYEQKGIQPGRVPLRTLLPILDAASVEDDETIHSMWANILSTASIPDSKPKPYPAFIEVLKQMSREEVIFYNTLYEGLEKRQAEYFERTTSEQAVVQFPGIPDGYELVYTYLRANGYDRHFPSMEAAHNEHELEVDIAFQNLERLGLLGSRIKPGTAPKRVVEKLLEKGDDEVEDLVEALQVSAAFSQKQTTTTPFGDMFAAVCRHPEYFINSEQK